LKSKFIDVDTFGQSACDIAVIGGGIVGVATALELSRRHSGLAVAVLEKEPALAAHQSGRNSGVIHAGVYYQPGSLKATLCKAGVAATIAFCREHGIRFEQCGKLLVATDQDELARMAALEQRCQANGIAVERLDAAELRRREPRITGLGALYVATTGITDYAAITRTMADLVRGRGGEVRTGFAVDGIEETAAGVLVRAGTQSVAARHVIVCGGVMADRLARLCGMDLDFQIVPFRGEYFRLGSDKDRIVQHLIYPIPDPNLPFLGVHLTRMIGGYVTVGPNAVLSLSRNGYGWGDISVGDLQEMLRFPGFRRLMLTQRRAGWAELRSSLSRQRYLQLCQRYCPELTLADLTPYRAGVRAQAVMRDGSLVHDFLMRETSRTIHVCNAPSPAATSAIPIARHIADRAAVLFELRSAAAI
jgi:L-2-hydroxyglutarate oxidase